MTPLSRLSVWKRRDHVTVTADSVVRVRPDGSEELVRWDDLAEVQAVTARRGPWSGDLFWVLVAFDRTTGCVVPMSAEGGEILEAALQALPGFNVTAIDAVETEDSFIATCWRSGTAATARRASDKQRSFVGYEVHWLGLDVLYIVCLTNGMITGLRVGRQL